MRNWPKLSPLGWLVVAVGGSIVGVASVLAPIGFGYFLSWLGTL